MYIKKESKVTNMTSGFNHQFTDAQLKTPKKVLVIGFHYPPDIAANPIPIENWIENLPKMGWKPYVLTSQCNECLDSDFIQTPSVHRVRHHQAFKKLVDLRYSVPTSSARFKLLNFFLINFILYPDDKIGWFHSAFKNGMMLIKKHNIDIILGAGPPWIDFCIARSLSLATDTPWIAYYFDPWTQGTSQGFRKKWLIQLAISRFLEQRVMRSASCCIHASEVWSNQLSKMLKKKVYSIPNGYDGQNFSHIADHKPDKKKFIVSYVGTLHFPQRLKIFFKGFRQFITETGVSPAHCCLRLVGTDQISWLIEGDYSLIKGFLTFIPYVPKIEAIKMMIESHILLLFLNNDNGWYPTKVFEYLAAGRPILATPDNGGVIKDLLKKTNAGDVVNSSDAVSKWISARYQEFEKTGEVKSLSKMEIIKIFERKNSTESLSDVLNQHFRCKKIFL